MSYFKKAIGFYLCVCAAALLGAGLLSRVSSAVSAALVSGRQAEPVIVIDAGHGGEDGGAVSLTGVYESHINLEIAQRLEDMLRFLGLRTKMLRCDDSSLSEGEQTVAARKASDLRARAQAAEAVAGAVLVSIHQNHFSQGQYRGAQMFYAATEDSQTLAEALQKTVASQVDPNNHRQCRPAKNVYLLSHVSCPAVLIECGFLSNPAEEQLLRTPSYQKQLAAAIAGGLYSCLEEENEV